MLGGALLAFGSWTSRFIGFSMFRMGHEVFSCLHACFIAQITLAILLHGHDNARTTAENLVGYMCRHSLARTESQHHCTPSLCLCDLRLLAAFHDRQVEPLRPTQQKGQAGPARVPCLALNNNDNSCTNHLAPAPSKAPRTPVLVARFRALGSRSADIATTHHQAPWCTSSCREPGVPVCRIFTVISRVEAPSPPRSPEMLCPGSSGLHALSRLWAVGFDLVRTKDILWEYAPDVAFCLERLPWGGKVVQAICFRDCLQR